MIKLYPHQADALKKMKNGCILCGGYGSGKSRTSLAYYYTQEGGKVNTEPEHPMKKHPRDLYIITTAKKRNDKDWEKELPVFGMSVYKDCSKYDHKIVIDSWNNIKKYSGVIGSFFIFDEQRVIGNGTWVQNFLKIAKNNKWILLSATPADTWEDYIPVFLANGFYKSRYQFINEHIVYCPFVRFRKVQRYLNVKKLTAYRDQILVPMDFERKTKQHHETINVKYDESLYQSIAKTRFNPYTNKPIRNASELCYTWRKIVNSDISRQVALLELFEKHNKIIIFYNFNYELDILRATLDGTGIEVAEWNGHKHETLPTGDSWAYLVQYTAGCEGWNCITANVIVFYSQTYSYKVETQATGRIDRLNTPFVDLYYYHFKSRAPIDLAINRALGNKKAFNMSRYIKNYYPKMQEAFDYENKKESKQNESS